VAWQRSFGFGAEMSGLRTHRIELQVTRWKWEVKGKAGEARVKTFKLPSAALTFVYSSGIFAA
jgi:hypothetical protein